MLILEYLKGEKSKVFWRYERNRSSTRTLLFMYLFGGAKHGHKWWDVYIRLGWLVVKGGVYCIIFLFFLLPFLPLVYDPWTMVCLFIEILLITNRGREGERERERLSIWISLETTKYSIQMQAHIHTHTHTHRLHRSIHSTLTFPFPIPSIGCKSPDLKTSHRAWTMNLIVRQQHIHRRNRLLVDALLELVRYNQERVIKIAASTSFPLYFFG